MKGLIGQNEIFDVSGRQGLFDLAAPRNKVKLGTFTPVAYFAIREEEPLSKNGVVINLDTTRLSNTNPAEIIKDYSTRNKAIGAIVGISKNTNTFAYNSHRSSIEFNGSTSYIQFGEGDPDFTLTKVFTLEFWFRKDNNLPNQTLLEYGTYFDGILIRPDSGPSGGEIYLSGTTPIFSNFSQYITIGEWTHLAITRDSISTVSLFINGELINSTTNSSHINVSKRSITLGKSVHASGQYHDGQMNTIRITKGLNRYRRRFSWLDSFITFLRKFTT